MASLAWPGHLQGPTVLVRIVPREKALSSVVDSFRPGFQRAAQSLEIVSGFRPAACSDLGS